MSVVTGHKAGTYLVSSPDQLVQRIRDQRWAYIVEDESQFAQQHLLPALDILKRSGQVELTYVDSGGSTRVWLVRRARSDHAARSG